MEAYKWEVRNCVGVNNKDKGCFAIELDFFQQETLKVRGLCKGLGDVVWVGGGGN